MNENNIPQKEEASRPITNGTTSENNNRSKRPAWIIVLAIAGILAVFSALGVGIFQLAGQAPQNISELGTNLTNLFKGEERLELTLESTEMNSGDTLELDIKHRNKSIDSDSYTIEFECDTGTSVELFGESISCNDEIDLDDIEESVSFSITTTDNRYTDIPVVVRGLESDITSDVFLTVVNTEIATETGETEENDDGDNEEDNNGDDKEDEEETEKENGEETTTKEPQYITIERKGRVNDPSGISDLNLVIEATGSIDNDGDFVEKRRINDDDRAAIKFYVVNDGTKMVPNNWYFSALLPTRDNYYYRSPGQPRLYPGDRVEFILAFDDIHAGETLYLNADPANDVKESSEKNNIKSTEFYVR
ncbi:MAG: hypothetical protein U5L75_02145 [Candidatus Campbellbacteria bacterium]|nr:hypothetical protein [Candidatus Campbellbacteria bacterium]